MKNREKIINNFNHLLQRSNDAMKGFQEASYGASYDALKKFLLDQATQRDLFAKELAQHIALLGGTPDDSTTFAGDLHRIWIDFKSSVVSNDNVAVLTECIRGEEKALEDYRNTLKEVELNSVQYNMLMTHIAAIEKNVKSAEMLIESFDKVDA